MNTPAGADQGTFETLERGPLLVITMRGVVTLDLAEEMFRAIDKTADGELIKAVLYDTTEIRSFHARAVLASHPWAKTLSKRGIHIAVVTKNTAIRFATTSVQMLMSLQIFVCPTVAEAVTRLRHRLPVEIPAG